MKYFFYNIFFFYALNINAQAPVMQWRICLGGTKNDIARSIINDRDGKLLIVGESDSEDGYIIGHYPVGASDVWLVKLDTNGSYLWGRCYGGYSSDEGRSIIPTLDHGYIIASNTTSNDGDVTGLHGNSTDFWILKLDSFYNKEWQVCLGSTEEDEVSKIIQTSDSGYLVTGYISAGNGDVSSFYGTLDLWVVKINSIGVIEWETSFGGSAHDVGNSCKQTQDGGYLIAGNTSSVDGTVVGIHSSTDAWVIKLNSHGQMLWQRCYGGSGVDEANEILLTNNGDFYVSGTTSSTDGDVSTPIGAVDYWLIKADSTGNIIWEKCYGGIYIENSSSAILTNDGGIAMIGMADLNNGMVTGTHGYRDYWICKADSFGNFEWGKSLGGAWEDRPYSICQTLDNGFAIVGKTESNDGDVYNQHGLYDYWVVKLAPEPLQASNLEASIMNLSIFQNEENISLKYFSKVKTDGDVSIFDSKGIMVNKLNILINEGINYNQINCSNFSTGIYYVILNTTKGSLKEKLIVEN